VDDGLPFYECSWMREGVSSDAMNEGGPVIGAAGDIIGSGDSGNGGEFL